MMTIHVGAIPTTIGSEWTSLRITMPGGGISGDGSISLGGLAKAHIELVNEAGGEALSGIRLQVRASRDGEWATIAEGDDFTDASASAWLIWVAGSPASLAAGASAQLALDLHAAGQLRVQAKTAGGSAVATLAGIIASITH